MNSPPAFSIPTGSSRACCTIPKATAARPRAFFTWPKAACPIPDDKIGVPKAVFGKMLSLALQSAARNRCACRSPPRSRSRPSVLFRCCSGRSSAPKCPASRRRKPWRSVSSRRAISSATSISSKASSATAATRTCRRTTPVSTPSIGPATPAASSSRRI